MKKPGRKVALMPRAAVIVTAIFGAFLLWQRILTFEGQVSIEVRQTPSVVANGIAQAPTVQERVGVPVRIRIPSIAVDAEIESVTLTKDGAMGVPKEPLNAAWFSLGPRPGETGSATIDGHVDWTHGTRAVFADLRKLKTGDTITVQDEKGADVSFVVRGSRKYDAAADATEAFVSNDDKSHLNIITCDGAWDKNAKQYTQRLVVFADRQTE